MGWCVSPRWWLLTIGAISGFFLIFWEQRYANSKHKEEFVVQEQNFGAPFRRLAPARRRPRQPSEDDIPRNALGFLCQDNPLVEDLGTRCRTISKNIGSLGCDRKIVDLAAEKSRNIDAIPPAFRMARVADACPESCGLCESKQRQMALSYSLVFNFQPVHLDVPVGSFATAIAKMSVTMLTVNSMAVIAGVSHSC